MYNFNFYKNLSKTEQKRFEYSFNMISSLFKEDYKNILIDKTNNKIHNVTIGYDKGIKGHVSSSDDITTSNIKYEPYSFFNRNKSYHISVHELMHALGKGNVTLKEINQKRIPKFIHSNVFISEYVNNNWISYGRIMSEVGVELLTSMSLSLNKKINNKERILADDFIRNNIEFWQSGYKLFAPIGRLMTYAMNNEFLETYYGLIKYKKGIIDRIIEFNVDNNIYKVPTNDYLYSLMIDGLHCEKVFDYYSNSIDAWKTMCLEMDNEFTRAVNSEKKLLDQYVIKKQILKIYNMFNNKLYILNFYKIIDAIKKEELLNEFNKIFDETLKSYGVIFDKYDEKMTNEALNDTINIYNREQVIKKPFSL